MLPGVGTRRILNNVLLKPLSRRFADEPAVERSLNSVTLLGRVGNDPQRRGTEIHPVVIFSMATSTYYKTSEGVKDCKTEWHRISVFKPGLRDVVFSYMKKGQRVYVAGKLTYGEVTNEVGAKVNVTSIMADDVIFFQ